jgi:hypothetical protein
VEEAAGEEGCGAATTHGLSGSSVAYPPPRNHGLGEVARPQNRDVAQRRVVLRVASRETDRAGPHRVATQALLEKAVSPSY